MNTVAPELPRYCHQYLSAAEVSTKEGQKGDDVQSSDCSSVEEELTVLIGCELTPPPARLLMFAKNAPNEL